MTDQNKLPDHINCKSTVNTHCDFYLHKLCKNTCNYANEVMSFGIGTITEDITKKFYDEDMRDF